MRTEKASSDDNDGAFLLLEDAAGNGNAEAMYLYAQFYDPTCTRPRGTIEPDMAQAHDWYKKALDAGYSGAAQDLERPLPKRRRAAMPKPAACSGPGNNDIRSKEGLPSCDVSCCFCSL